MSKFDSKEKNSFDFEDFIKMYNAVFDKNQNKSINIFFSNKSNIVTYKEIQYFSYKILKCYFKNSSENSKFFDNLVESLIALIY